MKRNQNKGKNILGKNILNRLGKCVKVEPLAIASDLTEEDFIKK